MITKSVSVTQARANIFKLIDETNESHSPIVITGKKNSAVMLSLEDWNAIEETLYLNSIPGLADSIIAESKRDLSECSDELDW